jgi:CRP-like cAMP-binding protein
LAWADGSLGIGAWPFNYRLSRRARKGSAIPGRSIPISGKALAALWIQVGDRVSPLNLTRGIGQEVPGGVELEVRNEDLANAANVTVFTASRLLNEWQRNGAVVKSRGKVLLRCPERHFLHQV